MLALLQRVTSAKVEVNQEIVGAIGVGLLVFLAVEANDTTSTTDRMLERILGYRIFADDQGKMNLSVTDIGGGLLLVPQFTLAANTSRGMRPSFSSAAMPEQGEELFAYIVQQAKTKHADCETGRFGAYMQVSLCNDGPATFLLEVN